MDDLNLHIQKGEIFGFIGHNGAGKTTTIKSLFAVFWTLMRGDFCGRYFCKNRSYGGKKEIAYIPDNPDLYEFLSGIRYLNFIADIYKVPKEERQELIKKYADMFEITGDLARPISAYSHGMKQKLAIISALIHKPKLMIMDEPFVGSIRRRPIF